MSWSLIVSDWDSCNPEIVAHRIDFDLELFSMHMRKSNLRSDLPFTSLPPKNPTVTTHTSGLVTKWFMLFLCFVHWQLGQDPKNEVITSTNSRLCLKPWVGGSSTNGKVLLEKQIHTLRISSWISTFRGVRIATNMALPCLSYWITWKGKFHESLLLNSIYTPMFLIHSESKINMYESISYFFLCYSRKSFDPVADFHEEIT